REVIVNEMNNNSLKLKVNQIFLNEDLPNVCFTDNCHICGSDKELWLVEGKSIFVDPTNIEQCINIWLCDILKPSEYKYYIKEIVYHFNGRWKWVGCITADLPQENDLADQTEERFTKIKSQHSKAEREYLKVEYRLVKPGPLRILKWDQHIQMPQDAYHSMAGKAYTLLE
ncbi:2890_t:CDS:2, partial [Racocetra persica]